MVSSSPTDSPSRQQTTISLAPYSVRYRRSRKADFLPFADPDLGDLLSSFYRCLERLKQRHVVHRDERLLIKVKRLQANLGDRWVEGLLESGAYGWVSDLRHFKTYDRRYRRQLEDAEVLPFYFLLHLPRKDSHGILILQRFGSHGVKGPLERVLNDCLPEDLMLHVDPLVPQTYLDHLRQPERIRKVRLLQTEVPEDLAEAFGLGGRQDVEAELVLTIGKGSETIPARLRRFLQGQSRTGEYAAVQEAAPYERVKVELVVGGKVRTLDVSDPGHLTAYHDITEAVYLEGGQPTWESLRRQAFGLLAEIRASTYSVGDVRVRPKTPVPPVDPRPVVQDLGEESRRSA